jgi:RNA polymerase sigma-70 factor (ECF subfamily)
MGSVRGLDRETPTEGVGAGAERPEADAGRDLTGRNRALPESGVVPRVEARTERRLQLSRAELAEGLRQATVPLRAAATPSAVGARAALPPALTGHPGHPDRAEFEQLFREYERYVTSIGNRILGRNNGVDDLVQEVFLVIHQDFHKLRELSSVKAWLATIATRLAWRQRGRPGLHPHVQLAGEDELQPVESPGPSPEQHADLSALLARLEAMPVELQAPWLLRFIDGETLPRIARLCACSQSTVQRRLREATSALIGE